jgi:hypothetical protein
MAKTDDKFPVLVGLLLLYPLLAHGDRPFDVTCQGIDTYQSDAATRHYDLAAFSVFKNEADIMEEWLEHHMWQVLFSSVLSIVACPPWLRRNKQTHLRGEDSLILL